MAEIGEKAAERGQRQRMRSKAREERQETVTKGLQEKGTKEPRKGGMGLANRTITNTKI